MLLLLPHTIVCEPATSRVRLGRAARLPSVLAMLVRDDTQLRNRAPERLLRARDRRRDVEVYLDAQQLLLLRVARHQHNRVLALQGVWTLARQDTDQEVSNVMLATSAARQPARAVALQRMSTDTNLGKSSPFIVDSQPSCLQSNKTKRHAEATTRVRRGVLTGGTIGGRYWS